MPDSERSASKHGVPSFSILLETANLDLADPAVLFQCLDSLAAQDLPVARAETVMLVSNGNVPPDLLEQVRQHYPWLQVLMTAPGLGYYEVKAEGLGKVGGEVVVYCDSDCRYEPDWLGELLRTFDSAETVEVVCGATSLRITGPYTLAVALSWSFRAFVPGGELQRARSYPYNNVAFRRDVLRRCPLEPSLPLYRGNCAVHAGRLARFGIAIWRQPLARAIHPPPAAGLRFLFWRMLLDGRDKRLLYRLLDGEAERAPVATKLRHDLFSAVRLISDGTWQPLCRLPATARAAPKQLFWLPVALAIVAASTLIRLVGFATSYVAPTWLLERGTAGLRRIERSADLDRAQNSCFQ